MCANILIQHVCTQVKPHYYLKYINVLMQICHISDLNQTNDIGALYPLIWLYQLLNNLSWDYIILLLDREIYIIYLNLSELNEAGALQMRDNLPLSFSTPLMLGADTNKITFLLFSQKYDLTFHLNCLQ